MREAAKATPPRFIIAQVQDDFYGNVGTFNDRNLITDLDDNKNRVLSLQIQKINGRTESIVCSTRKIGGSNPPLGTNK